MKSIKLWLPYHEKNGLIDDDYVTDRLQEKPTGTEFLKEGWQWGEFEIALIEKPQPPVLNRTGKECPLGEVIAAIESQPASSLYNKEMAFFKQDPGEWTMHLSNLCINVSLGEVDGEIITEGPTMLDAAQQALHQLLESIET